jgi:hypothetical protein
MPIPILTRAARGCRAGGSSVEGVSGREAGDDRGIRGDGSGAYGESRVRGVISFSLLQRKETAERCEERKRPANRIYRTRRSWCRMRR